MKSKKKEVKDLNCAVEMLKLPSKQPQPRKGGEVMKQCLWCGNEYIEGQEGVCRECWEKNQFLKQSDRFQAREDEDNL